MGRDAQYFVIDFCFKRVNIRQIKNTFREKLGNSDELGIKRKLGRSLPFTV